MYQMIGALGSLKSEYMDKKASIHAITSSSLHFAHWSLDYSHATH